MSIRTRIVKVAAALTLSAAAAGVVAVGPAGAAAGDPSQWGWGRAEVVRSESSVAGDPSQWLTMASDARKVANADCAPMPV